MMNRVAQVRNALGVSRAQFARIFTVTQGANKGCEVDPSTVSNWESGKNKIQPEQLAELISTLEDPRSWIAKCRPAKPIDRSIPLLAIPWLDENYAVKKSRTVLGVDNGESESENWLDKGLEKLIKAIHSDSYSEEDWTLWLNRCSRPRSPKPFESIRTYKYYHLPPPQWHHNDSPLREQYDSDLESDLKIHGIEIARHFSFGWGKDPENDQLERLYRICQGHEIQACIEILEKLGIAQGITMQNTMRQALHVFPFLAKTSGRDGILYTGRMLNLLTIERLNELDSIYKKIGKFPDLETVIKRRSIGAHVIPNKYNTPGACFFRSRGAPGFTRLL